MPIDPAQGSPRQDVQEGRESADRHVALTEWWESELPKTRDTLLRHLRARLPALPQEHDDLVQETLLDLTREVNERGAEYPASWKARRSDLDEADKDRFHALAFTILRRRVADYFTRRHRDWTRSGDLLRTAHTAFPTEPSAERQYLVAQLLRTCVEFLSELSEDERRLVMHVTLTADTKAPLSAADRQRLHRLRRRLALDVATRFGDRVTDLLDIAD